MCDPDCLCVIFSFIRDEQPGVGWGAGGMRGCRGWAVGVGGGGFTGNGE